MVLVPAGSAKIGSPRDEPERQGDREDQVKVTFAKPFAVGRFAVTRAEFGAFANATAHKSDGGCHVWSTAGADGRTGLGGRSGEWTLQADRSWASPGFPQNERHPVACINWHDARAYVAWLSSKTSRPYRLLSEAEREYVARAGTSTPFWWGAQITTRNANYDGNYTFAEGGSKGDYRQQTVPVDTFAPNPWGLFNVHGNVWEWTEDCWNASHSGNPGDGGARARGDCGFRVLRGGSWLVAPKALRAANRGWFRPGNRYHTNGLRVARTLDRGWMREVACLLCRCLLTRPD
jgi:formylglycine-generating enzyme required for sulfatase activity